MPRVFISHAHGDRPIVDAVAKLLASLFADKLSIFYSTNQALRGGIAFGEDGQRWIETQIRETDAALVILSPNSLTRAWVLWETAALSSTLRMAVMDNNSRKLYPLSFGLAPDEIPGPLRSVQVVIGTDLNAMTVFLHQLIDGFEADFNKNEASRIVAALDSCVRAYISELNEAMLWLPIPVTEAAVQDWLARIDAFRAEERSMEISVLEDWLNIAFGRTGEGRTWPLDLRLHRKLGELYAFARQPRDAARQFELAQQLAPRDIFLLLRLGNAYLDQGDGSQALRVIGRIEQLDPEAFVRGAEAAALKARLHRESGDNLAERDMLKQHI